MLQSDFPQLSGEPWAFAMWLCGLAFVLNVDHGIIPAAVPDIEANSGPQPISEALLQGVAVVGILVGIATTRALKLRHSRLTVQCALWGLSIVFIGTWLTPLQVREPLPLQLHLWRFLAGLLAGYLVVYVPEWLNGNSQGDFRRQTTARYFSLGIAGAVAGYLLVPLVPLIRLFTEWLAPNLVGTKVHQLFFLHDDFRQAFFYAAIATIVYSTLLFFRVPANALLVHDAQTSTAPSLELVEYRNLEEEQLAVDPQCECILPAWIAGPCQYPRLQWTSFAIFLIMIVANGMSFWLLAFLKEAHQLTDKAAVSWAGIILVGGAGLGMNYPPNKVVREASNVDQFRLTPALLRGFAFCTALSALCNTCVCLVSDTITTAVLLTMSVYFGACTLPLAQAAYGYAVPKVLRKDAMSLYQLIYQATWLLGPLVPVLIARTFGGVTQDLGIRCSGLLSWLAVACFMRAQKIGTGTLQRTQEP